MNYVVTGAAGFIGSHLANRLLDAGHRVVGIDCFTDSYDRSIKEENARGIALDALDLTADYLDFSGFDGVFHLAGQGGAHSVGEDASIYLNRNVHASQRAFHAAARAGVRVVFASSSSVYGAAETYPTPEDAAPFHLSPYGASKLACEHLARAFERRFDLDVVVLRYFSVFGPRQRPDMAFARIAAALIRREPFDLFGDGTQTRSWTYVSDAVAATIMAMNAGRGTYNVGGSVEASIRDVIALFERLAGHSLDVREHPAMPAEPGRTSADTTRIRSELEWTARTSLEEGVRAQWAWTASRDVASRAVEQVSP